MSSDRYKCNQCSIAINAEDLDDQGKCPQCHSGLALVAMCPKDHTDCGHDVIESIAYCSICGAPVCPVCGSHDVSQVSRITGLNAGKFICLLHRYMSDVSGWNSGKREELKDRHRVGNGEINNGTN